MDHIPAIGVVFLELGRVHHCHVHELGLIRNTELLEDDSNLPWIGASGMGEESDGLGHIDGDVV